MTVSCSFRMSIGCPLVWRRGCPALRVSPFVSPVQGVTNTSPVAFSSLRKDRPVFNVGGSEERVVSVRLLDQVVPIVHAKQLPRTSIDPLPPSLQGAAVLVARRLSFGVPARCGLGALRDNATHLRTAVCHSPRATDAENKRKAHFYCTQVGHNICA